MANTSTNQSRPALTMSRDEARELIQKQIDIAEDIPSAISINKNSEARRWYDYTTELLRRICTTDELTDEFTGRNRPSIGGDISVGHYLEKLLSIHKRLDLYLEEITSHTALSDPAQAIQRIIYRFHTVVRQLRNRYSNRPTIDISDEYDVQDLFHALLLIYFDDIRTEERTPSYAGGSSRMDFLLKAEKIVVEIKKTRPGLSAKEVGEQLSIDIVKYRSHPDCDFLICFVYDPEERILNPRGFEKDLNKSINGISVKVYIIQK
jgi:hypothetical protein